jgi:hypothetical protein
MKRTGEDGERVGGTFHRTMSLLPFAIENHQLGFAAVATVVDENAAFEQAQQEKCDIAQRIHASTERWTAEYIKVELRVSPAMRIINVLHSTRAFPWYFHVVDRTDPPLH